MTCFKIAMQAKIASEVNSGLGRVDFVLYFEKTGVLWIFEYKITSSNQRGTMILAARQAVDQIKAKSYSHFFSHWKNVKCVFAVGMACFRNQIQVEIEELTGSILETV